MGLFGILCLAAVRFATPDAEAGGSGVDWARPMTLGEALAAVCADPAGGEIDLRGGRYLFAGTGVCWKPQGAVTIRGGCGGGPMSTLDGCDLEDCLEIASEKAVTIERVGFCRGRAHGLVKSGRGELVLTDCDFTSNGGRVKTDGRGAFIRDCVVRMRDCVFACNLLEAQMQPLGVGALMLSRCPRTFIDDCRFIGNGYNGYGAWHSVSCIRAESSPLTVRDTRFLGNRARLDHNGGAHVYMGEHSSGCAFTNCVFAGNESVNGDRPNSAPLVFNTQWSSKGRIEVVNCVFSNNVNRSKGAAAGFLLGRGQAKVVGCKFIGNDGPDIGVAEKDSAIVLSGTAFDREEKDAFAVFAGKIEKEK